MDLWAMVMALGLGRRMSLDGCHDQLRAPPNFVRMKAEGPKKLLMAQEVLSCTPAPPRLHPPPQGTLAVEAGPWTLEALGDLWAVQQGHPWEEA